ncbi:MAG: pyridoxal-phosphate dependent enzyme [Thermodesulfobacteriota bacterium]
MNSAAEDKKCRLKISQLARRAGVSIPTVKHYVREGLLPRPKKTSRNMAYYSEANINRIRLIKKLQKEKYLPLDVIKRLMDTGKALDEEPGTGSAPKAAGYPLGKTDLLQEKGPVHPISQDDSKVYLPNLNDIRKAAARIAPFVHRTPAMTCASLDKMTGARLSFKCENFQKVGAFKFRGAANAVLSLAPEEAKRGVVTHSSGNHAQALALAAQLEGLKAYIVMPENAPNVKIAAVRGYGAEVILCRPSPEAREAGVRQVIQQTGAVLIHPYDDVRIITGQATCALEFHQQVPDLDMVMAPVGGGGLLSGTALATRFVSPQTRVLAAEPELADDACQSFRTRTLVPARPPQTIADGLLTSLGEITFPLILEHVHDIVTVSEKNIIAAMRIIWERMKIVVEPSGAVPLGAVLEHPDRFKGQHVGIILSGGNVDLQNMLRIFCSTRLRR